MKWFRKNYKVHNGFVRKRDTNYLLESKLYIYDTGICVAHIMGCEIEVTPTDKEYIYKIDDSFLYKEFVAID